MIKPKSTGRKTKFKDEYCDMLIKHYATGLSFESFAGEIEVNRDTLYAWTKQFPAFRKAKELGEVKSRGYWEKLGIMGISGKVKNFNAAVYIFTMKNRFSWKDAFDNNINANIKVETPEKRANDIMNFLGINDAALPIDVKPS